MRLFDIPSYFYAVVGFIRIIVRNWKLTRVMVKREISDRYVGQMLGIVWAILHPLIQVAVYWFLFSVVFKMRIPEQSGFPSDYFLYILSGLAPWLFFSESVAKGATSIISQASLVKQVVFPIEILPLKGVLASCVTFITMVVMLIGYKLVTFQPVFPGILLLPMALMMQIVFVTGINLILGSVGVYFKDIKDLIQALLMIVIYILPLFYLPTMVPSSFQFILKYNPLSHVVWCWQDVFFFNGFSHPLSWMIFALMSVLSLAVGAKGFGFLKTYFGNIL